MIFSIFVLLFFVNNLFVELRRLRDVAQFAPAVVNCCISVTLQFTLLFFIVSE